MNPHGIYTLTLRTPDGKEQISVAYIPNEQILKYYIDKAHKAGLQIEIKAITDCKGLIL